MCNLHALALISGHGILLQGASLQGRRRSHTEIAMVAGYLPMARNAFAIPKTAVNKDIDVLEDSEADIDSSFNV